MEWGRGDAFFPEQSCTLFGAEWRVRGAEFYAVAPEVATSVEVLYGGDFVFQWIFRKLRSNSRHA